jgi:hypothetical protein
LGGVCAGTRFLSTGPAAPMGEAAVGAALALMARPREEVRLRAV